MGIGGLDLSGVTFAASGIVFTGGSALLELHRAGNMSDRFACENVGIVSASKRTVLVTTTGLGDAVIAPGPVVACERPPKNASAMRSFNVSSAPVMVTLFVPAEALVDDQTVDGKLVVIDGTAHTDLTVKARYTDDTWRRVWRWAGATIFPALLTFELAYLGFVVQQRWRDRRDAWKTFDGTVANTDTWAQLNGIFADHVESLDKTYVDDPQQWSGELQQHLDEIRQFETMPLEERTQLRHAFRVGDREAARTLLARLYPHWAQYLGREGRSKR
jgi:hypothetical protein